MKAWSTLEMPPQRDRRVIITGATGGLGFETALALAAAGADVLLTGRSREKGEAALERIRRAVPRATVSYMDLDLASLASVHSFAEQFGARSAALDLLINNAGVMMPARRFETADGFELQFGTNYLGHYALTALLLPKLLSGHAPRVVSLSSGAHRIQAAIRFDDLQWTKTYRPWPAYAQSKLAMLLFAFELQRQSDQNGWGIMSNAAHPGYARTGLQSTGPEMGRTGPSALGRISKIIEPLFSQSAAAGALPTLYAATSPEAEPAGYYGPQGFVEMRGPVGHAKIGKEANDLAVSRRLWDVSAALTHSRWTSAPDLPGREARERAV